MTPIHKSKQPREEKSSWRKWFCVLCGSEVNAKIFREGVGGHKAQGGWDSWFALLTSKLLLVHKVLVVVSVQFSTHLLSKYEYQSGCGTIPIDSQAWRDLAGWLPRCPHQVYVKVAQSCLILCDPMDYIVHGILQTRILEWVAFPFSRASSQPRNWTGVSYIAGVFFTSWATSVWCSQKLLHWQ